MNKIATLCIIFLLTVGENSIAQPWLKSIAPKPNLSFYDIQKAFNNYWKDKEPAEQEEENESDGGYQQFKRWENFMEPRVYPSGNFDPSILFREYTKFKKNSSTSKAAFATPLIASWTQIGPVSVPDHGGGAGRINVVEFDPLNSAIMWVGICKRRFMEIHKWRLYLVFEYRPAPKY